MRPSTGVGVLGVRQPDRLPGLHHLVAQRAGRGVAGALDAGRVAALGHGDQELGVDREDQRWSGRRPRARARCRAIRRSAASSPASTRRVTSAEAASHSCRSRASAKSRAFSIATPAVAARAWTSSSSCSVNGSHVVAGEVEVAEHLVRGPGPVRPGTRASADGRPGSPPSRIVPARSSSRIGLLAPRSPARAGPCPPGGGRWPRRLRRPSRRGRTPRATPSAPMTASAPYSCPDQVDRGLDDAAQHEGQVEVARRWRGWRRAAHASGTPRRPVIRHHPPTIVLGAVRDTPFARRHSGPALPPRPGARGARGPGRSRPAPVSGGRSTPRPSPAPGGWRCSGCRCRPRPWTPVRPGRRARDRRSRGRRRARGRGPRRALETARHHISLHVMHPRPALGELIGVGGALEAPTTQPGGDDLDRAAALHIPRRARRPERPQRRRCRPPRPRSRHLVSHGVRVTAAPSGTHPAIGPDQRDVRPEGRRPLTLPPRDGRLTLDLWAVRARIPGTTSRGRSWPAWPRCGAWSRRTDDGPVDVPAWPWPSSR